MRIRLDRKLPVNAGYVLSFAIAAIPAFGWIMGFDFGDRTFWEVFGLVVAKVGAFGGLALMALTLIMSGRYVGFRRLFGGLDKLYTAHQYIGVLAVLLLVLHPVALSALRLQEGFVTAFGMWVGVMNIAVFFGALALYGLVALVVWSIFTKARYELFVMVHRLLGIVFIIGALHAFMAGSVLAANPFVFWYMLVLSVAAGFTYVQYSLFGDIFHRPIAYTVDKVVNYDDNVTEVTLKPTHRMIRFRPGQFVYVRFEELWGQGYHPFSIASGKHEHTLQLAIRHAGDFTEAVAKLRKGSKAKVRGPFGMFLLDMSRFRKQLWIAGGIGVVPFLSGARSKMRSYKTAQIEMVYATSDALPYAMDELEHIRHRDPGFNLVSFHQERFGFVSLKALQTHLPDFDERDIYICGPPVMLQALLKEAEEMGVLHRVNYEEFSY